MTKSIENNANLQANEAQLLDAVGKSTRIEFIEKKPFHPKYAKIYPADASQPPYDLYYNPGKSEWHFCPDDRTRKVDGKTDQDVADFISGQLGCIVELSRRPANCSEHIELRISNEQKFGMDMAETYLRAAIPGHLIKEIKRNYLHPRGGEAADIAIVGSHDESHRLYWDKNKEIWNFYTSESIYNIREDDASIAERVSKTLGGAIIVVKKAEMGGGPFANLSLARPEDQKRHPNAATTESAEATTKTIESAPFCSHVVLPFPPTPINGDRESEGIISSFKPLTKPMPTGHIPSIAELKQRIDMLLQEFPWAHDAIHMAFDEILARRQLGERIPAWTPLLLAGLPGCGKSRLARRIAETVDVPFIPLSLGGQTHDDTKILRGTTRGWASGEPSPIIRFMRDNKHAQPLVLLDEIGRTGPAMQSTLLGLLEPETSARWTDSYLQVPCDMSRVLYVATTNSLQTLNSALISRMRPILVPQPARKHYAGIAQNVVKDIAKEWRVPVEVLPEINLKRVAGSAKSVRDLVQSIRSQIVREIKESTIH